MSTPGYAIVQVRRGAKDPPVEIRVPVPEEPTDRLDIAAVTRKAVREQIKRLSGWGYRPSVGAFRAELVRFEPDESVGEKRRVGSATRYAGQCQSCEQNYKLTGRNTLVHHGYRRPGTGEIVGDCRGVGLRPYELSCDAIKEWLRQTAEYIGNLTERIGKLERAEVPIPAFRLLPDGRHQFVPGPWKVWSGTPKNRDGVVLAHELDEFRPGETDPDRAATFAQLNKQSLRRAQALLAELVETADHYEARIKSWKLRPLITVEEMEILAERERAPLARGLSKSAAALAKALSEGRKAKLFPDVLREVLGAIGWSMTASQVPVKFSSNSRENLPVRERLIAAGFPLAPLTTRLRADYDIGVGSKPGQMVIAAHGDSPEEQTAWLQQAYAALAVFPSAPPEGPAAPFTPHGMYLTHPRVEGASSVRRALVVADNVWVVMPSFTITAADGEVFALPEIYGVDYDMSAMKPAGFYKWADDHGIRAAISSLVPSDKPTS